MGALRRCLALSGSVLLLGVLSDGAASAAPLDLTQGQKYSGDCNRLPVVATAVPGNGDFTPYWIDDGKQRRLLVPSSITLVSSDPELKARHLLPGIPLAKPGSAGTGPDVCTITGTDAHGFAFTLQITGRLG